MPHEPRVYVVSLPLRMDENKSRAKDRATLQNRLEAIRVKFAKRAGVNLKLGPAIRMLIESESSPFVRQDD